MTKLIKSPTPRNFKTGKVSLSSSEAQDVKNRLYDTLVILKFGSHGEILFTKNITSNMILSLEDKGDYYLMSYKA